MGEETAQTTPQEVDVIIIGMGPAGESVGGQLAEAGLDVVGIEGGLVGGECPYWGCVPSKMMIRAGNLLAESRRVSELAGTSTTAPDWSLVADRIRDQATDNWDDTVAVDRFVNKGGTFVRGYAKIVASDLVEVAGSLPAELGQRSADGTVVIRVRCRPGERPSASTEFHRAPVARTAPAWPRKARRLRAGRRLSCRAC